MRDLRGLLQLIDKIPRQQLLDAIDRMIGDALEDIVQIALWIDVIEFAGLDQAINDRRTITAGV